MMYLVKWLLGCDISYMSQMLCSTFHPVCVFVLPGLLLRVPAKRAFWPGCSSLIVGSLGVTYLSLLSLSRVDKPQIEMQSLTISKFK